MVLTARSGERVPSGLQVAAPPERFVPLSEAAANSDVREFLRWVLERTGEPWTVDAQDQLAALYGIPGGRPADS